MQSNLKVKPYELITIKDSGQRTFAFVHKSSERRKFEGISWDAVLHDRFKFSLSKSSGTRRSCRVCGKTSKKGDIEVVFELQRVASQTPCRAIVCLQLPCLNHLKQIASKRQYTKVGIKIEW